MVNIYGYFNSRKQPKLDKVDKKLLKGGCVLLTPMCWKDKGFKRAVPSGRLF